MVDAFFSDPPERFSPPLSEPPPAYTAHQAVNALWGGGLKARADFSRLNYETVLDAWLQKRPEFLPHLKDAVASLLEEEEWMPTLALVKRRLEALRSLEHQKASAGRFKPRTMEWADDGSATARGRIPYDPRRDTEEYRSRLAAAVLKPLAGVTAADLLADIDAELLSDPKPSGDAFEGGEWGLEG